MKTTEILTLGAIVAGIFVLGKKAGVAGVGSSASDYIEAVTEFGVYKVPICKFASVKRKKIIQDFYSKWMAKSPDGVFNDCLGQVLIVNSLSKEETSQQASFRWESTLAVFGLSEILKNAIFIKSSLPKKNNKQKPFSVMLELHYLGTKLMVGVRKSDNAKVQYSVTDLKHRISFN